MTELGNTPKGRHAVVTGGNRGIGAAIAEALASAGARLTIMARDAEALESQAARLRERHGRDVRAVRCDVADESSVTAAFREAVDALGEVEILVNNAGVALAAKLLDTTRADWDRLFAVNVTGTWLCSRAVLPGMLAAKRGRIVNVASTAGVRGAANISAYSASKHAVVGLTRSLAAETARHGITVNAVCPGYTDTAMARMAVDNVSAKLGKSEEEARRIVAGSMSRGVLVQPAEVASAVLWLCSDGASGVSGQAIAIAGGEA